MTKLETKIKLLRKSFLKTKIFQDGGKNNLAGACGIFSLILSQHIPNARLVGTKGFSHVWIETPTLAIDGTYSQLGTQAYKIMNKGSREYHYFLKKVRSSPVEVKEYLPAKCLKDYAWFLKEFPEFREILK